MTEAQLLDACDAAHRFVSQRMLHHPDREDAAAEAVLLIVRTQDRYTEGRAMGGVRSWAVCCAESAMKHFLRTGRNRFRRRFRNGESTPGMLSLDDTEGMRGLWPVGRNFADALVERIGSEQVWAGVRRLVSREWWEIITEPERMRREHGNQPVYRARRQMLPVLLSAIRAVCPDWRGLLGPETLNERVILSPEHEHLRYTYAMHQQTGRRVGLLTNSIAHPQTSGNRLSLAALIWSQSRGERVGNSVILLPGTDDAYDYRADHLRAVSRYNAGGRAMVQEWASRLDPVFDANDDVEDIHTAQ